MTAKPLPCRTCEHSHRAIYGRPGYQHWCHLTPLGSLDENAPIRANLNRRRIAARTGECQDYEREEITS